MGFTYSFFDNQTIGAADLNKLTKRFVTEGIADIFTDGLPYNISILNSIVSANATDGTVPDTDSSLKVFLSGGKAVISPGTAFFADGTIIEVDSEGISLSYTANAVNYVYLVSDSTTNSCRGECVTNKLSGNVLLLAVIEKDGSITDKRKYAKGKIASSYSSGRGLVTKASLYWSADEITNSTVKEIDISTDMANGLFTFVNDSSKTKTFGFVTFDTNGQANTYISGCLMSNTSSISANPVFSTTELILQNAADVNIIFSAYASVSNGKVTITPLVSSSYNGKGITVEFFIF